MVYETLPRTNKKLSIQKEPKFIYIDKFLLLLIVLYTSLICSTWCIEVLNIKGTGKVITNTQPMISKLSFDLGF